MRSGSRWHPCRARTSAPACRLRRCRSSPWRVTQPGPIVTVRALTERRLARIARTDPAINAFTGVTAARGLAEADAVLTGTLNMGEYAYDFTGENAHDGAAAIPTTPVG